ncbi:MAG: imelysin family protein [Chloroflexota bacterium]
MRSIRAFIVWCVVLVIVGGTFYPLRTAQAADDVDLSAIRLYVVNKATDLKKGAVALQNDSNTFYNMAQSVKFDYAVLWQSQKDNVVKSIQAIQKEWTTVSPLYEQMEGIVAGVPFLSKYDPILDAGAKGDTNYNVLLPDGRSLEKPGNLFGLLETSLWGTDKDFIAPISVDFDGNGKQDFGEVMPDAILLKGFADALSDQTGALLGQAIVWEPSESDVFTALVINVPTMADFFNSWKTSRFVMGDKATHNDFVVISRLSDINDNIGSWQVMWKGLSPLVEKVDAARNGQINAGLADLKTYVDNLYSQEHGGKRFTPEQADIFASEAQNRATTIVGQITQVAAELNITLPNQNQ